jgi:transcriptional regulator with XRE-family HTH domain
MSVRLAMEISLLDLPGLTWDRIEDYEEDQAEPSVEELAAIMAVLGVTLAQVDGLLPWPAEALEATLASYVARVAEAKGSGRGDSEARRSRGEARGVEP